MVDQAVRSTAPICGLALISPPIVPSSSSRAPPAIRTPPREDATTTDTAAITDRSAAAKAAGRHPFHLSEKPSDPPLPSPGAAPRRPPPSAAASPSPLSLGQATPSSSPPLPRATRRIRHRPEPSPPLPWLPPPSPLAAAVEEVAAAPPHALPALLHRRSEIHELHLLRPLLPGSRLLPPWPPSSSPVAGRRPPSPSSPAFTNARAAVGPDTRRRGSPSSSPRSHRKPLQPPPPLLPPLPISLFPSPIHHYWLPPSSPKPSTMAATPPSSSSAKLPLPKQPPASTIQATGHPILSLVSLQATQAPRPSSSSLPNHHGRHLSGPSHSPWPPPSSSADHPLLPLIPLLVRARLCPLSPPSRLSPPSPFLCSMATSTSIFSATRALSLLLPLHRSGIPARCMLRIRVGEEVREPKSLGTIATIRGTRDRDRPKELIDGYGRLQEKLIYLIPKLASSQLYLKDPGLQHQGI